MAIGTIITEVAVLLIHIDRNAADAMKPSSSILGLVPTSERILSAMRLCRLWCSTACASRKLPRKSMLASFR